MKSLQHFDSRIPKDLIKSIVAHRGFHDPSDSLNRPLENTLEAFLSVWSLPESLQMCECDVTTTKDGVVVVGHDSNFDRLAKTKSALSQAYVETKTFDELRDLELKDGSRVLSLEELLQNLQKYPQGRLIIEIKENANVELLVDFFSQNDRFLNQVPVIMSFERSICLELKRVLKEKASVMLLVEVSEGQERRQQLKISDPTAPISSINLKNSVSNENILGLLLKDSIGTTLDGIYFQYQHEMMTDGLVQKHLQQLSSRTKVGVFLAKDDRHADKISTLSHLAKLGVGYINSDIPESHIYFEEDLSL